MATTRHVESDVVQGLKQSFTFFTTTQGADEPLAERRRRQNRNSMNRANANKRLKVEEAEWLVQRAAAERRFTKVPTTHSPSEPPLSSVPPPPPPPPPSDPNPQGISRNAMEAITVAMFGREVVQSPCGGTSLVFPMEKKLGGPEGQKGRPRGPEGRKSF